MGRLKRYKVNHTTKPLWAIEYRLHEDPPILDEERDLVEIVDAEDLVKTNNQIEVEKNYLKNVKKENAIQEFDENIVLKATINILIKEMNIMREWMMTLKKQPKFKDLEELQDLSQIDISIFNTIKQEVLK